MVHNLGATSIIILSRSGMDAAGAANTIEDLRKDKPNVSITVRKCDVADASALAAVLDECSKILPPIRGVVQAAMVLQVSYACELEVIRLLANQQFSLHRTRYFPT